MFKIRAISSRMSLQNGIEKIHRAPAAHLSVPQREIKQREHAECKQQIGSSTGLEIKIELLKKGKGDTKASSIIWTTMHGCTGMIFNKIERRKNYKEKTFSSRIKKTIGERRD